MTEKLTDEEFVRQIRAECDSCPYCLDDVAHHLPEALDRIERLTQEKAALEDMPSSRPLTTFEKQAYEVGRRAGFRQATDLSRGGSWVRVDALTDTSEGPTLDLLQSFVIELLTRNEQLTLALAEERRQKGGA